MENLSVQQLKHVSLRKSHDVGVSESTELLHNKATVFELYIIK